MLWTISFLILKFQSALARQSLYVKFDPLVKGASPLSPGELIPSVSYWLSIRQRLLKI